MKIVKGIFNIITSFSSLGWSIYLFTLFMTLGFKYEYNDIKHTGIIILTEYFLSHPYWIVIIILNLLYTFTIGFKKTKIFLRLERES